VSEFTVSMYTALTESQSGATNITTGAVFAASWIMLRYAFVNWSFRMIILLGSSLLCYVLLKDNLYLRGGGGVPIFFDFNFGGFGGIFFSYHLLSASLAICPCLQIQNSKLLDWIGLMSYESEEFLRFQKTYAFTCGDSGFF
jgi:hypothetical protein